MTEPVADTESLRAQEETYHRGLLERSVVLPSGGSPVDRFTLGDSMLGLAALAVCLALARESIVWGMVALYAVFPILVRTHVIINRRRSDGRSSHAGIWMVVFGLSILEMGVVVGIIGLGIGLCAAVGGNLGYEIARKNLGLRSANVGGIIGLCLLGIPWIAFALIVITPRILLFRDRISKTL
jgi:hypothetical protein